jgi:RNA polymerase sigma-70 factor, ECF subfamily
MTGVAASSDPGALALELFERHRGALRSYLRLATGSADLADELSQDVYLRVITRGATYQPRGRDRAWLFSIARHLVVDHFRRRTTTTVPLAEIGRPPVQMAPVSLKESLANLPEREREVFLLSEVGGLTYAEIAIANGSTPAAVRSAIYRARVQLRAEAIPPAPQTASRQSPGGDDD